MGPVAALTAGVWFGLLNLPSSLRESAVVPLPMLGELALVAGVVALIRRWSARRGWSNIHRLALACRALLASMLFGFFAVTAGNRIDQLGQGVAGLVAVVMLALLVRRLLQRSRGRFGLGITERWAIVDRVLTRYRPTGSCFTGFIGVVWLSADSNVHSPFMLAC